MGTSPDIDSNPLGETWTFVQSRRVAPETPDSFTWRGLAFTRLHDTPHPVYQAGFWRVGLYRESWHAAWIPGDHVSQHMRIHESEGNFVTVLESLVEMLRTRYFNLVDTVVVEERGLNRARGQRNAILEAFGGLSMADEPMFRANRASVRPEDSKELEYYLRVRADRGTSPFIEEVFHQRSPIADQVVLSARSVLAQMYLTIDGGKPWDAFRKHHEDRLARAIMAALLEDT